MDVHRYLSVISGRERGFVASVLRGMLACAVPAYASASLLRNLAFDRRWKRVDRVSLPVVSVGNLTTGGTGKTPVVAWIVNWLRNRGLRPAILSRGYRSLDEQGNDEKRLMDQLCPEVPHEQDPRRIHSARRIAQEATADVLVLDDAFQHRQFHRDLDIVLIDALNPWGYGWQLPRGLLRESRAGLSRANLVLLTRCDHVSEESLAGIEREVRRLTDAPLVRSAFAVTGLVNCEGARLDLPSLERQRLAAFCGIGNPDGFRQSLAAGGLVLSTDRLRPFPDHHHYATEDFQALGDWARSLPAETLITTRKDLVKIPRTELAGIPLWALDLELALENPDPLTLALGRLLPSAAPGRNQLLPPEPT